jgi:hypothetical protein
MTLSAKPAEVRQKCDPEVDEGSGLASETR